MTKLLVSCAFLRLLEDGAVGLDEPLEKYVPGFAPERLTVLAPDRYGFEVGLVSLKSFLC